MLTFMCVCVIRKNKNKLLNLHDKQKRGLNALGIILKYNTETIDYEDFERLQNTEEQIIKEQDSSSSGRGSTPSSFFINLYKKRVDDLSKELSKTFKMSARASSSTSLE
uniref:Uncharacterized protein n=1 Tax=Glossina austeni TaxID=7395 RepID=A0A1A9UNJ2_GLOAU